MLEHTKAYIGHYIFTTYTYVLLGLQLHTIRHAIKIAKLSLFVAVSVI